MQKTMLWAGRIITALVVLFLIFDSSIKLLELSVVHESMVQLGYPTNLAFLIGAIELVCLRPPLLCHGRPSYRLSHPRQRL